MNISLVPSGRKAGKIIIGKVDGIKFLLDIDINCLGKTDNIG